MFENFVNLILQKIWTAAYIIVGHFGDDFTGQMTQPTV